MMEMWFWVYIVALNVISHFKKSKYINQENISTCDRVLKWKTCDLK